MHESFCDQEEEAEKGDTQYLEDGYEEACVMKKNVELLF